MITGLVVTKICTVIDAKHKIRYYTRQDRTRVETSATLSIVSFSGKFLCGKLELVFKKHTTAYKICQEQREK